MAGATRDSNYFRGTAEVSEDEQMEEKVGQLC
jgi:hypothetical protein